MSIMVQSAENGRLKLQGDFSGCVWLLMCDTAYNDEHFVQICHKSQTDEFIENSKYSGVVCKSMGDLIVCADNSWEIPVKISESMNLCVVVCKYFDDGSLVITTKAYHDALERNLFASLADLSDLFE